VKSPADPDGELDRSVRSADDDIENGFSWIENGLRSMRIHENCPGTKRIPGDRRDVSVSTQVSPGRARTDSTATGGAAAGSA
jgi:hypothetical protein